MNASCIYETEAGVKFHLRGTSWYQSGTFYDPPDGELILEEIEVNGRNVTDKVYHKHPKLWAELEDFFDTFHTVEDYPDDEYWEED